MYTQATTADNCAFQMNGLFSLSISVRQKKRFATSLAACKPLKTYCGKRLKATTWPRVAGLCILGAARPTYIAKQEQQLHAENGFLAQPSAAFGSPPKVVYGQADSLCSRDPGAKMQLEWMINEDEPIMNLRESTVSTSLVG